VVFLIAVELIDVKGMRRILAVRKHEFAVALLTLEGVDDTSPPPSGYLMVPAQRAAPAVTRASNPRS
jgi:hypothetical protein